MADLNELKDINADLPLTHFPDEIDELENFSDADEEINSAIIKYNNLMKQGETAKAEELYSQYSLKKYIVSAYFLNKIQHMIIACERSISSVKKYFSFSDNAPTGTTSQPNGYIWGKVLSVGDSFKKVLLKLKENNRYIDIYPRTTADNVLISENSSETVKNKISELDLNVEDKMNKNNPHGTGSFGVNNNGTCGDYAVSIGKNNSSPGYSSVTMGDSNICTGERSVVLGRESYSDAKSTFVSGKGLRATVNDQCVQGKYNAEGDYAYILGGGTSNTDRKNIFTVDWNGNVKGNSFTAEGDIIFDNGKSLKSLNETVSRDVAENTSQIAAFNNGIMTLNNSNSFVIKTVTSGHYDTSETVGNVKAGEIITFNIVSDMDVNDNLILIPYYSSQYTNADLRMFGSNTTTRVIGSSKTITVTASLQNISSSDHNLVVYWYAIVYTKLNIS